MFGALDSCSSSLSPSPAHGRGAGRCAHCGADHSGLVVEARFCPACGKAIAPLPATTFTDFFSSVVLRGYANAMFRLGVRHEFRHNDDEAVRCYAKASRLGNETAQLRLSEIPLAVVADDAGAQAQDALPAEHGTTVA